MEPLFPSVVALPSSPFPTNGNDPSTSPRHRLYVEKLLDLEERLHMDLVRVGELERDLKTDPRSESENALLQVYATHAMGGATECWRLIESASRDVENVPSFHRNRLRTILRRFPPFVLKDKQINLISAASWLLRTKGH